MQKPVQLPPDQCPMCGKVFKRPARMAAHLSSTHPGSQMPDDDRRDADTVHGHTTELLRMLLVKRLLDNAIKAGDGDTLALLIKFMTMYFKALKCPKYALACFEFTAQQELFLSEKMKVLVRQERFVNHQGRFNTNMAMDLDHSNKLFKENFRISMGEPTAKVLNRLSKSQDRVVKVIRQFEKESEVEVFDARRRLDAAKYQRDVNKISDQLLSMDLFTPHPGRRFHSQELNIAGANIMQSVNLLKHKQWLQDRVQKMVDQPFYRY